MEHIAAEIRVSRELRKKGKDQVSAILFVSIPEVEVIVSHGSQSSLAQSQDLLDDRRAGIQFRSREKKTPEKNLTKARFSRILLWTSFVRKEQGKIRQRTFSIDPQKRPSGLPLFEKTASEEPGCSSLVLRAALNNVIRGWIGR